MELNIKAFGIARDILGDSEIEFELTKGQDITSLKAALVHAYPEFEKLVSFNIAVNEEYQDDDHIISDKDEVVIIPPVSGG